MRKGECRDIDFLLKKFIAKRETRLNRALGSAWQPAVKEFVDFYKSENNIVSGKQKARMVQDENGNFVVEVN